MDPANWFQPERFDPSRFLNFDGSAVIKPDAFVPFGVGRRLCLGAVLGKAELFLFMAGLFHSFHFRLPDGVTQAPRLDDFIAGTTVSPKPFSVQILKLLTK